MKKIFLYGDYDIFSIGSIKYYKEKEDYFIITLRTYTALHHQEQTMIEGIQYVKGPRDWKQVFKETKCDWLSVLSGNELIETMQEFNKTKLFCDEHQASLMVMKGYSANGVMSINPCNLYDPIREMHKMGI